MNYLKYFTFLLIRIVKLNHTVLLHSTGSRIMNINFYINFTFTDFYYLLMKIIVFDVTLRHSKAFILYKISLEFIEITNAKLLYKKHF